MTDACYVAIQKILVNIMAESRYNDIYYQITQIKSCLIDLKTGTETNLSDIHPPIDWQEIFRNENPVEIEVGCGKGRFLLESAKCHPEINYVGIERASKYIQRTKDRLLKHNVTRVLLIWSDAPYFVDRYIADGSVKAYHIYFPDPWPKKRRRKRRIFNNTLWINGLIRTLDSDDGRIYLATDYEEYFYEIRQKLDHASPLAYVPPDAVETGHIPTNFEIKYLAEGRTIYRAVYKVNEQMSENIDE